MSTLIKCSEIKIKSNYNHIGHKPYNTVRLEGSLFFKRMMLYNENLIDVVFKIDENGRVLDEEGEMVALPCPRYCDDDKEGKIVEMTEIGLNIIPNTIPNTIPPGYDKSIVQTMKQDQTIDFFLEIVVDYNGDLKEALIGIDANGRIMDANDNGIIIK